MNSEQYDAIIVLGSSLTPDGYLSDADKTRLQKVTELYKSDVTKAIIVCGSHGYKQVDVINITQAEAYANYLVSFNVDPNAIYLEKESKETLGNILFAQIGILQPHEWHKVLVIPTQKHASVRIEYLLKKVLGPTYNWEIVRIGESDDAANRDRELLALKHSKEINDQFTDGDTDAIYKGLMETHPAYGGTKWTLDELREEMK